MNSTYLSIIILCLALFTSVVYLFYLIKKDGLRATAIKFIVKAEEIIGSGHGEAKMDIVIDALTEVLPAPIRLFVTKDTIKGFAQCVFNEVKDALDYKQKDNV